MARIKIEPFDGMPDDEKLQIMLKQLKRKRRIAVIIMWACIIGFAFTLNSVIMDAHNKAKQQVEMTHETGH